MTRKRPLIKISSACSRCPALAGLTGCRHKKHNFARKIFIQNFAIAKYCMDNLIGWRSWAFYWLPASLIISVKWQDSSIVLAFNTDCEVACGAANPRNIPFKQLPFLLKGGFGVLTPVDGTSKGLGIYPGVRHERNPQKLFSPLKNLLKPQSNGK